jgi:hypothetical protein
VNLTHIAVVSHVGRQDVLADAAFATEACRRQLAEHAAPAWGLPAPGCFFYGHRMTIPDVGPSEAVIGIVADAGMADAAGYHTVMRDRCVGVVDLSRSGPFWWTVLSHEVLEAFVNPWLSKWRPSPGSAWRTREYAVEVCDPVQECTYSVDVEVSGIKRPMLVADFILPAWFDAGSRGPYDYTFATNHPGDIAPGGYQIARDDGSQILYLPDRTGVMKAKAHRPMSRTARIVSEQTVREAIGQ